MIDYYIPDNIAEDYKYIVFGDDYVDFYSTDNIISGNTYTFYRNYYFFDYDLFQEYTLNATETKNLECVEINPTHNYIYRKDYSNILFTSFIYILGFVVIFNIITSIIKKGGLLSGLI